MTKNDRKIETDKEKYPVWMCISMPLIAGLVMLGLSIACLFLENYEGNYKLGLLFMILSVTLILVSVTGVITKRIIESDDED